MSLDYRTLFAQEMAEQKILIPWIALSLAHGSAELSRTLEAVDKALAVYSHALESGLTRYLKGPVIKPVFRKTN